jgi:hypothetical protein
LQFAYSFDLILIFAGADLKEEHQENFPLLVLIQLHLSKLGIIIERSLSFWNTLCIEVVFDTLLRWSGWFFGHGLLKNFFEVFLELFDFDLAQVSFVLCFEFFFLEEQVCGSHIVDVLLAKN